MIATPQKLSVINAPGPRTQARCGLQSETHDSDSNIRTALLKLRQGCPADAR